MPGNSENFLFQEIEVHMSVLQLKWTLDYAAWKSNFLEMKPSTIR